MEGSHPNALLPYTGRSTGKSKVSAYQIHGSLPHSGLV